MKPQLTEAQKEQIYRDNKELITPLVVNRLGGYVKAVIMKYDGGGCGGLRAIPWHNQVSFRYDIRELLKHFNFNIADVPSIPPIPRLPYILRQMTYPRRKPRYQASFLPIKGKGRYYKP